MKLHSPLRLLAALSLAGASFFAQAASSDVTVAYQTTVDPAKVAKADGAYEKATDAKINGRKFDNGADIIAAIASGDVQIAYLGSSPLTAAVTLEEQVRLLSGVARLDLLAFGRTGQAHRAARHHGGDGVFVDHLADSVLQQNHELVEGFDLALQLDAVNQIDGNRYAFLTQGIQVRVL